jgi:diacylglycerol kinase (ATP)
MAAVSRCAGRRNEFSAPAVEFAQILAAGTRPAARRYRAMRATVIHNPTAGANGHEKDSILSALKLADIEASYFSTKKADMEKALAKSADLIVAAGGDGTISKVLKALPDRSVPVAILPLGTANNVARSLGIAGTPQELVEMWKVDHFFLLDLGMVKGIEQGELFLESFGIGLFGKFLRRADKKNKAEGADNLRKGRETLQKLIKEAEPVPLDLSIDGKALRGEFIGVEILNIPFTGPGLPLGPKADAGDGKLDVVCFKANERKDFIEWLDSPQDEPPPAVMRQGAKIEVAWEKAAHRLDDQGYEEHSFMQGATLTCAGKKTRILVPVKQPAQRKAEESASSK